MSGKTRWIIKLKTGRYFHGIDKGSKQYPPTGIQFNDWIKKSETFTRKKDAQEVIRNYNLDADILKVRITFQNGLEIWTVINV